MATLLVVEQDDVACTLLLDILTTAGYDVTVATNGREARCVLDTIQCDIIVTDLAMPAMDGVELVRALRTSGSMPKVIGLAGDHGPFAIDPATRRALGVAATLQKPVTEDSLIATVKRVLQ